MIIASFNEIALCPPAVKISGLCFHYKLFISLTGWLKFSLNAGLNTIMSGFVQPHCQPCHKCHAVSCNYQIVKPTDVFDELLLRKPKQTSWKNLVLSTADGKIMSYCSSCSTSKRTRRCAWAICLVSCCCSCHDNLIQTSILWTLFDQFPVSLMMCCREPDSIPARTGWEDEEGASVSSRAFCPIDDINVKKNTSQSQSRNPWIDMNATLTVGHCRRISTTEERIWDRMHD